jgi:hypothetical protein
MADYGLSTTVKRYGTGSFYSPYSSSRTKALLIEPTSGNFRIAAGEDFIFNLWVQYGDIKVNTPGVAYPFITFGDGGFTDGWAMGYQVGINQDTTPYPYFRYNGTFIKTEFDGSNGANISPTENGWSNYVVKRTNGVITLTFTNTSAVPSVKTANYAGAIGASATGGAFLGATNPFVTNGNNGAYIDELFFARGISSVQRRNPTLGSINDGSLATTVFLYQFDGNYVDDETGVQLFSAALTDNASTITASLTQVTSLKTAQASITATTALTGNITSITGTQQFSSTPNSKFTLSATLTETYRVSPVIVNNSSGMFLNNITTDTSVKKFGSASYRNAPVATGRAGLNIIAYGDGDWLAFNSDWTRVFISADSGATWTVNTATGLTETPTKLVYLQDYWIASSGANAWYSANGIAWTAITMPTGYTAIGKSITYANNFWNIVVWSSSSPGNGIVYVYRAAARDAGLANIAPSFSSTTGRVEIAYNARTSLSFVQVGGVAVSGVITKFTLMTSEVVSGTSKNNTYIYTSSNNTSWAIDTSIVQQTNSTFFGSIATDSANNWIATSVSSGTAGDVYAKAGSGAWTKKTKSGVTSGSSGVLYAVGKWWVSFDEQGYYSTDLGTTWTFATYGSALANTGAVSSTQLAILEDHNANGIGSEVKFCSTTTGTIWTASRITGQINLPETIEYTAGNLGGRYSSWKTMDFWIYTTTPSTANWLEQGAITHGNGYNPTTPKTWTLQVGNQTPGTDRGFLRFDFLNQTSQLATGNFTNNAWHHVRISRNGVSTAMYLDGTRVDTDTLTSALPSNTNPLVFGGYKMTGASNYYLDELLLTQTLLTDPTVSSFSVPTGPWPGDADTDLLLHFNGDLIDDNALPLAAYLGSVFSINALAGKNIKSSVAISSSSTMQVSAAKVKDISLTSQAVATISVTAVTISRSVVILATAFDISANNTRSRGVTAAVSSTASLTTSAQRLIRASVAAGAIVSQIVVIARKLGGFADLTAVTSISALTSVTRPAGSTVAVNTNLVAANTRLRDSSAAVVTSVSLSVTANRIQTSAVALVSSYSVISLASRTARASSRFGSITSTIVITARNRAVLADLNVTTNLSVTAGTTKSTGTAMNSSWAVSVLGGQVLSVSCTMLTTFSAAAQATRLKIVTAAFTAVASANTTASRTARASSNFGSIATVLTATAKRLSGIADITAVTTLTASPGVRKQSSSALVNTVNLATNSGKLVTVSADLTANSVSSITATKVKVFGAGLNSSSTQSTTARVNKQIAAGLASNFVLVARPFAAARSAMVVTSSLAINTRVARSSAQAVMTTRVLWSYIYDKTVPFTREGDLWVIPTDVRLHVIPASTALWPVELDQRTYIIETDLREYTVLPAGTEFTIEE